MNRRLFYLMLHISAYRSRDGIWGGTDKDKLRLLGRVRPDMPEKMEEHELIKIEAKFKPQHISCLKIIAKNLKKLPEWHPAKGQPAWLFVDEIFLN